MGGVRASMQRRTDENFLSVGVNISMSLEGANDEKGSAMN
jgi:hypothetical protein